MRRVYKHLLGLNNLRKFCGNAAVFNFGKNNFKLEILNKPKQGKVLVLAPHPDDDIFGCGGTLALHAEQGDEVKIIYFAGDVVNINQKSKVTRGREAEEAAKMLKVSNIEFWGLKDNKFTADSKNIAWLKKVIKEYQPKIIYCPSFTDPNPDHYEVGKMLHSVIASDQRERGNLSNRLLRRRRLAMTKIFLYEIWTPIYANRLIKIDSVIEQKKAAIKCHHSQLKDRSYLEAIIGLNQYRAGMFNAGEYAEAFTEMDEKQFVKLFQKFIELK